MVTITKKRKRRSDRSHLIYQLTNCNTSETYIGITVVTGRAYHRSLKERFKRHVSRAKYQNLEWRICQSIREHGPSAFKLDILSVVRGKAAAHAIETQLIHTHKPSLNTASI